MELSAVVEELKNFGLSGYEAQAYATLLFLGPTDATTLSQKTGVPFGRVYDVLNGLVEKNLLQVQDNRPKLYKALHPRVALASLLSQRRREFDERYEALTKAATQVERALAPRMGRGTESTFYNVSIGPRDTRAFLTEKLSEAQREVVVTLEFQDYDPADDLLFEAFRGVLARGITIKVILHDKDIPKILETPYNAVIARTVLPALGHNLHVRVSERERVPFAVVDGEKAMIGVKNPLDPESYFALVYVWDPKFGSDLKARFDTLWEDADLDVAEELAAGRKDFS
ncbi:MAG TPA: helix-turn-helix domain-containing protein [Candidatus Thermoplasmatota archaeon]|nr:helix-turn-helix domain-containing protein [Candidatus Thermoplasmatota archaeon]